MKLIYKEQYRKDNLIDQLTKKGRRVTLFRNLMM